MRWIDLLFAHWPVDPDMLKPWIPRPLELETCQGSAWLGIVPFVMTKVGLRGLPPVPFVSTFAELNVRTYVRAGGRPGVWFFSLDAASPLAVALARATYHLPYFRARMRVDRDEDTVRYRSTRTHRGARPAALEVTYRPAGEPFTAAAGSIEEFLTSRYCLYAVDKRGACHRGEIHHLPWQLQRAEAKFGTNTCATAHGLEIGTTPCLLHFSRTLDVAAWPLQKVNSEVAICRT